MDETCYEQWLARSHATEYDIILKTHNIRGTLVYNAAAGKWEPTHPPA